jgi:PKHD-type hydroxylase
MSKVATKSKAEKARQEQKTAVDVTTVIGEVVQKEGPKPLQRYSKDPVKDYAHSFNWHLGDVIDENWAYVNELFTPEECDAIIAMVKSGSGSSPLNYGYTGDRPVEDPASFQDTAKIRISPVSWIRSDVDENRWIWEKIAGAVININNQFFNYDLREIQSLQFTAYDAEEEGFYGKHIDMMYKSNGTRKLSLSVQLSNPEDYEGGNLLLYTGEEPLTLPKSRGTGLFFPSYSLHEVTPVTKGLRYSLVAWFLGPRFK